jgi:hypothetical protein
MYEEKVMGIIRPSFLVDERGRSSRPGIRSATRETVLRAMAALGGG